MRRFRGLPVLALLLGFLAAGSLTAQTVEVLPLAGGGEGSAKVTWLVTQACLDTLFDAGCIVSDEKPRFVSEEAWADLALGTKEAREGFADLVLAYYIEWKPSQVAPGRLWPASILYRVVRVSNLEVLLEGGLSPPPDRAETYLKYEAVLGALGTSMGRAFLDLAGRGSLALAVFSEYPAPGGHE